MNKLLITGCLLATALAAVAMPTKKELAAAQKLVEGIIAPDVKALNAGRKTVKDVADIQMKLASDAQSEAEKYLLLQSAFKLYSRGEEFDSAAKVLTAISRDIKNVPPELIAELVDKEFTRDMGLKAPKEIEAVANRIADSSVKVIHGKATVNGYTWSYRVKNGEAEIVSEKDGKFSCAVSPIPTENLTIPSTLGGSKVTSIGQEAFRDCKGLEAVMFPPSITNIGVLAFYSCDIKSVNIPASVTSIGTQAFSDNSELMSFSVEESNPSYSSRNGLLCTKDGTTLISGTSGDVEIPSGVTSIEGWAFTGRRKLTSVTIPPSVTNIGRTAFRWCSGLNSITIPPAVTRLDENVFRECSGLTSVVIPSNVTSIGWCAFYGCSGLKSVTIPSSVTTIGGNAFGRCGELKSVPMSESVTSIGREAFRFCRALESVTIPSNLKILEYGVFASTGLKSVTIPTNVTSIGRGAVAGCIDLTAVAIPDSVTNIGIDAFRGSGRVKSVAIPSSVRSISDHAFAVCGELTSVTMLGERPTAPNNIFERCGKLTSIHVSAKCKSWAGMAEWQGIPLVFYDKVVVDGYTWSYCARNGEAEIVAEKDGKFACAVSPSPKGDVTIPSTLGGVSVTRIGQCAFKDCKGMSSVKIPSTVKSFGSWGVFAGCSGLTSVVIPDGVKSIEECAFWGCSNLKSVTIPPSVTKISDAAFGCCGGLASLTIPPTVKELRTQVFFGCGALTSVTIPASVEKIGWAAFVYSGELKEINVDPQNKWFTSVDGALYTKDLTELVACPNALTSLTIHPSVKKLRAAAIISCGKLESLTIPEGVTEIGWQAIKDCGSLKTVTIPSTVRRIAEIAFCNCRSLTSVAIPESVSSIGKGAFENCGALTSVTMRGERPNSSGDIFPKCANLKSIHVPANAKSWAGMTEWQGIPLVFDAR